MAGAAPVAFAQATLDGSGLVGKLEGPTFVTDPAQMPKKFSESPQLAELVKAGKLPPVEQRLPAEPLVIKPVQEVGKYGGTWRRGFTGPGDAENGNRIVSSDRPFLADFTGTKTMPSVAKSGVMSEDGKSFTIELRKGLRWSDGAPFTADDWVFWFQDLYSDKTLVPSGTAEMNPDGKPGRLVKVDDYTVRFEFDVPYYLFESLFIGDTAIGGGPAVRQSQGRSLGSYAPAHYLKQFLPKYAGGEDAANAKAKAAGFDNWARFIHVQKDWTLNPDLPVLGPWKMTTPINNANWVLERNPYYWAVDTAGNQLPYLDRVVLSLGESVEIINLRAIAGEYDMQERHIDLGKLPLILENQEKGNYKVHLDLASNGSDTNFYFNQSFDGDAEIQKWLRNADFRRALSMGIDRDQLNETFWLGVGTPSSTIPADNMPEFPGKEWRTKWSTFDQKQANALLDKIGLTKKDADGFRLRTDNGQRLIIDVEAVQAFLPWPKQAEMVADQWKRIGIFANVKDMERTLWVNRVAANQNQISVWTNGGTELLYLFPRFVLPVDTTDAMLGIEFAKWFSSNGATGKAPTDPELLKMFDLYRSAAGQKTEDRNKTAQEIWKIFVDQQYAIGTVGQSPALMGVRIVSNRLGNTADRVCIAQHCRTPGTSHPETWFFK